MVMLFYFNVYVCNLIRKFIIVFLLVSAMNVDCCIVCHAMDPKLKCLEIEVDCCIAANILIRMG